MNIETTKYIPITREHIEYRIKWLADPEVNKFLGTAVRNGLDRAFHDRWFDGYEKEEAEGKRKIFMIEFEGKFVGQVGLLDINQHDKNAVLYIVIGEKDYWGKGIAKAALQFIHDYAFNKLGLRKINLYVHTLNVRAMQLYKKSGYKQIGISHENVFRDGKFEDETLLELINPGN